MQKDELKELLTKISEGKATDQEIALYNRYFHAYQANAANWTKEEMGDKQEIHDKLKQSITSKIHTVKSIPLWKRPLSIAAMLVVCLGLGLLVYKNTHVPVGQQLVEQDVVPGGNKATLTLADGKTINLSDAANGTIATQSSISISKTTDGKLVYKVIDQKDAGRVGSFNVIATPVGGQYQVMLPDGTKVWLNAASSVKFPTSFTALKERRVEVTGEAYFEVAHNKKQPFVVKTGEQELTVLGTHFNVNSYADEGVITTTLVEGAVLVRNIKKQDSKEGRDFVVLKPGEQSSFNETFKVTEADVEMATAWKDGSFLFNELELHAILKQLARWYNVKVDYSNVPENRFFTGFISRDVNLSKVLEMMEVTGHIEFKIENNTIKIVNLNK